MHVLATFIGQMDQRSGRPAFPRIPLLRALPCASSVTVSATAPRTQTTSSRSGTSSIKVCRMIASAPRVLAGRRRGAPARRSCRSTRALHAALHRLCRFQSAQPAQRALMFSFPGKRWGANPPGQRPTFQAPVRRWAAMEVASRPPPNRRRFVAARDAYSKEPMRPLLIGFALFSAFGLLVAACSQDPGSAATSTSGPGGAPNCDGIYLILDAKDGSHPCDICMHENCCAELATCPDHACLVCANYSSGMGCTSQYKIAEDCANTRCLSTCSPGVEPRDK